MTHHEVPLEPVFANACIRHVTCNTILSRGNPPGALLQALQQRGVERCATCAPSSATRNQPPTRALASSGVQA